MGKYLLIVAVLGVYIYLYMDLPKDMQAATQYEIVKLHNPLIPLPSDVALQEKSGPELQEAKVILVSSPTKGTPKK